MGDIVTQLPIKITDGTNTAAISGSSALKVDASAVTQPVSGTITAVQSGTYTVAYGSGTFPVSGTVTAVAGTGTFTTAPTGTQAVAYGSGTFVTSDLADGSVAAGAAGSKSMLGGLVFNTTTPTLTNAQQVAFQGDASGNLKVTGTFVPSGTQTVAYGSGTFPVSGTVTNVPSGTQTVAGTVTNVPSGTQTVAGTVTSVASGTFTTAPTGTQAVSYGSGTFVTSDLADGSVAAGAAGSKSMLGGLVFNTATPTLTNAQQVAFQGDASGNLKVVLQGTSTVTSVPSGTQTVAYGSGTFPVSGTVTAVAGTGTFTTAPTGTQAVSGTVTLNTATVTAVQSGTYVVSGTVTEVPETSGVVTSYSTSPTIAAASTGTLTYVVTAAKTMYWKGVMAGSSGGPCKVTVLNAGATVCVAFYSTTQPFLNIVFPQPILGAATTTLSILIQNNAGATQDVYGTFFGAEH